MLTVLLISLLVLMVIVVLITLAVLVRSMFSGEQDMAEQAREALTWRPPFVRGGALRKWATETAERLTQDRLADGRAGETAIQIATELEEGTARVMLPLARQAELERIVACPETGQGTVGVTAPEALRIAADLRQTHSKSELERIFDTAVENINTIASRAGEVRKLAPLPCPLQGKDHVCCVYGARPLRCRPLHAVFVAKGMGGRNTDLDVAPNKELSEDRYEQTVAQGIEIGLTRTLESAGLDANVYELNSALAMALATPDAATRWARGEHVFANCQTL